MNNLPYDITVVGGGIVGAAVMFKLQVHYPGLKILLIEKENHLAAHQTGHNSGVMHSGLYYKPGSKKAQNCVAGRKELVAFAKEHKIAHDVCGKVVVATEKSELPFLEKIYNNGIANGTEGLEKISPQKIREIEPFCTTGISGLWVPSTGIIDFIGATNKMTEIALGIQENSKVILGEEVLHYLKDGELVNIKTSKNFYQSKKMIFCGGLQADRLARKDNLKLNDLEIVGFRGDYYELTEDAEHKVKNLIYPVPNPAFPFLGVHFTRMVLGGVECGPNAVFTFKREGYGKTDFNLRDSLDALLYIGTRKLFSKHWKYGIGEYRRAFSKNLFLKTLQRLIPSLSMEDLKPGRAGVRAMALGTDGAMIDDFKIEFTGNNIHVLNAPSPAATASLAIGDQIREMAEMHLEIGK